MVDAEPAANDADGVGDKSVLTLRYRLSLMRFLPALVPIFALAGFAIFKGTGSLAAGIAVWVVPVAVFVLVGVVVRTGERNDTITVSATRVVITSSSSTESLDLAAVEDVRVKEIGSTRIAELVSPGKSLSIWSNRLSRRSDFERVIATIEARRSKGDGR